MIEFARLERRLDQAVDRFERVEARLAAATDGAEIVKLGQEHAELKPLVDAISAVKAVRAEIANLEAMAGDPEMAELAEEELKTAKNKLPDLQQAALLLLAPKDKDES
ncbi:MAG: PCRF domain-containing protein, partial [Hyphomonadaceae bacterium]|nr:PCRF domain-containing protein [Hyphomonadaceae bacterium]